MDERRDDKNDEAREVMAWAYKKLCAMGIGGINRDSAMMMDRLNEMLQSPLSATRPINGITLIKLIRDQRDQCADALRNLLKQVDDFCAKEGEADFYTGEAIAALAKVPTYEQQLRNIAEGIGMTYEGLLKALSVATDGKADAHG